MSTSQMSPTKANKAKKGDKGKKGDKKTDPVTIPVPKANKSNKSEYVVDTGNDSIVSFDDEFEKLQMSNDFSELKEMFEKTILKLKADFEKKNIEMKSEFDGKVEALYNVVKIKEETIGKLQCEIGQLQQSVNFLTNETSIQSGQINQNKIVTESLAKKTETVQEKTIDLEDQSRRNNLVFYNIPEVDTRPNEHEDCEKLIRKVLGDREFFPYEVYIERAHRLGRRKAETASQPRPIIVCFSYFKEKQHIIMNGRRFRGTIT